MRQFAFRVYLLALILRLIPVLLTFNLGIGLDDMFQYDMLARSLASGNGYRWYAQPDLDLILQYFPIDQFIGDYDPRGVLTCHRAPGYPAFLAAIYSVSGLEYRFAAARVVQAMLMAALAPLTFFLGLRLFPQQPAVAKISSVILAAYPKLVVYPITILSENLFIPLLLASVVALLKAADDQRLRYYLLSGLLFGLTALTRSVVAAILPFALVWVWSLAKNRKGAVALLVCFLLVTIPWSIRNYFVFGRPSFVECSLGYNLHAGYHPESTGTFKYGPSLELFPYFDDAERDELGVQLALGFIRDDPTRVPILMLYKLSHFFGLERRGLMYFYSNNFLGYLPFPALLAVFLIFALPFVVIATLAAFALPFMRWDKNRLLALFVILGYLAPHILLQAEPRFHLAVVPGIAVFAAYAWVERRELLARARLPGSRRALILALVLVALLWLNWGLELYRDADKLAILFGPEGNLAGFPY